MAEQKFIPTITVIEGIPPIIDIITFYEELLGVPNILEGFIAAIDGRESNGIAHAYGELGVVMKNWPLYVDVSLHEGDFSVITPKLTAEAPGDADKYFIDADGDLGYFFEDIPFTPSDFAEFEWGLDFGDLSTLSLTGDLIDSITHIAGSPQAGNWSAVGDKRPVLLDGAAVLDGIDDELLASFVQDNVANDEIFIVAKKPIGVESYFISSGRTWVFDGDSFKVGATTDNRTLQYEASGSGGDAEGAIQYPDGEYQLYYWKNVDFPSRTRYNGFLDEITTNGYNSNYWFDDHGGDPQSELTLGRQPKAGTQLYYPSSIKEILYFSNLDDEKRKCIEVYLKYKHDLSVYVNPYHFV